MSDNPIIDGIIEAEAQPDTGRDPVTGRWLPANRSASPGRKAQAYLAKKLDEILPGKDKSAHAAMVDNMIAIAIDDNPRTRKEAIWAYRALAERAYGVPLKDQEELDAMRAQGVQIQIVQLPALPAPPPAANARLLKPEFDD
jgi:hypothetical protein